MQHSGRTLDSILRSRVEILPLVPREENGEKNLWLKRIFASKERERERESQCTEREGKRKLLYRERGKEKVSVQRERKRESQCTEREEREGGNID